MQVLFLTRLGKTHKSEAEREGFSDGWPAADSRLPQLSTF
jgi:hypothetical protein